MMRDTIYCLTDEGANRDEIEASVHAMVQEVAAYVPGYRLKQAVQFDRVTIAPQFSGSVPKEFGLKVSVFIEVEGAAHYLPSYAGNLDIMTSAAVRAAEQIAALRLAA
jgi:acetaldehyde dehydrogenase